MSDIKYHSVFQLTKYLLALILIATSILHHCHHQPPRGFIAVEITTPSRNYLNSPTRHQRQLPHKHGDTTSSDKNHLILFRLPKLKSSGNYIKDDASYARS